MHVSIRTLKSQDILALEVDPRDTVGAFKKRFAACLPYNGVCKLMLRGQALSKNSTFESLQLLPFEFLVALPMAGKKDASQPLHSTRIGLATDSVSALTQATEEHPTSHTLPDAQKLSDQEDIAHALTDTMSLSPGLYTLLPGYVSRPQVLHPLPSEPLTSAASLQSTGPSLGAWTPHEDNQQPHPNQPAAVNPSQTGVWADLAAELKAAPISAPADSSTSDPIQHSLANVDGQPDDADKAAQQSHACADRQIAALKQTIAVKPSSAFNAKSQASVAKPRPPRQTCRKLSTSDSCQAQGSANVNSQPTGKKKATQPQNGTRVSSAKEKSKGNVTGGLVVAAEQATAAAAEQSEAELEGTAKGDPSRQAKNAAFKGSGALGLSRRLSSRLLTPQEVNVMSKLPLPAALHRLDEVMFPPVNGMYGFLLRQHIQPTWRAIKSAAANAPGGHEVQLEDVQLMADLCPDVVILRDPQQYASVPVPLIQSPNKSIRQWRKSVQTEASAPSLVNPIDAEDAMLLGASSGSGDLIPQVNAAHPMEINTDGSGTVFGGQTRKDRLIVEIMDPGRKTIGSTSLAEMGVDQDAAIQEVGMDARSLAARLPSRGPTGSEGRKGQTDRGAKNAQQRRHRAFRQSLIRAVVPSHQAFLRDMQRQQAASKQRQERSTAQEGQGAHGQHGRRNS